MGLTGPRIGGSRLITPAAGRVSHNDLRARALGTSASRRVGAWVLMAADKGRASLSLRAASHRRSIIPRSVLALQLLNAVGVSAMIYLATRTPGGRRPDFFRNGKGQRIIMRVLVCDDHVMFAEALASWLWRRGCESFSCGNAQEAVRLAREVDLDLCLMDLAFPGGVGGVVDCISKIKADVPGLRVVVLSGVINTEVVNVAVAAGASGFICKASASSGIADAVIECLTTNTFFVLGPTGWKAMPSETSAGQGASVVRPSVLTARERQVLDHLTNGQSAARIALALGITYATARSHVQSILTKLGAHNRLEAVAIAAARGLNAPPVPSR